MADFILIEGDQATFQPTFGAAVVKPESGELRGSGPGTLNRKRLCVAGDEAKVAVEGCPYQTPQFSIPGTGTLKIAALAADQRAKKTATGGKAVLLKGTTFTATLEVQVPAKQLDPATGSPIPDPTLRYAGKGAFVTTNLKLRGT
jgi:hypothetical protein